MSQFITWPYYLLRGHSNNPSQGACAMDAVNWLVHGQHGDAPACACPAIRHFVTRGNDAMPDDARQRLLPYLHRIAGSLSPEHEGARERVMWLGAVRVFGPRALDAAGLHDHAQGLRSLPDDVTKEAAVLAADGAAWAAAQAWTQTGKEKAVRWAMEAAEMAARTPYAGMALPALAVGAADAANAWEDYFQVLDAALNAGPQGEPWSANTLAVGLMAYQNAGGVG